MKKVDGVIAAYSKKFGGFPSFLLLGADDEYIIKVLTKCLETGEELQPEEGVIY